MSVQEGKQITTNRQSPCANSLPERPSPIPARNSGRESTPRIADMTSQAQPGSVIEVPKGAQVTPLIPWPQEALTPSFKSHY